MGCDIHMHVEYKNHNNHWVCGDYFVQEQLYDGRIDYSLIPIHSKRNYALFAVLADVRNSGYTEYIDRPRGLPEDVTDTVKEDYEKWDMDAHSCSYFTLKELIDFHDKKTPLKRRGLLSPGQLKDLDERGILPTSWCQGINIEGYERRDWEEENNTLLPLISKLIERADELNLIYDFLWEHNFEAAYYKSDRIRIVFWFDN